MKTLKTTILSIFALTSLLATAQDPEVYTISSLLDGGTQHVDSISHHIAVIPLENGDSATIAYDELFIANDSTPTFEELLLIEQEKLKYPLPIDTSIDVSHLVMPPFYYLPVVFKPYTITLPDHDKVQLPSQDHSVRLTGSEWIDTEVQRHRIMEEQLKQFCMQYPSAVKLNLETLPERPKKYVATVDPKTATIKIEELAVDLSEANKEIGAREIDRKNWLHTFNGTLQFSQAYNSPNWYQGGNNNLNLIGNFIWNVKLNPKFHPNLLFENTIQYKVAINSAPDDTLRNYSISEDLFQINTKVGLKASNNWYYSATMQFKTQLLQSHPTNKRSLTAAFLSPGELNLGLGMTYNHTSADKRTTLGLSINPLSYNMICYRNTAVAAYAGKKILNQYGSNVEAKLTWKPIYYMTYTSRLYAFTNYKYLQGDWENTLSFAINQYLSTQIYVHLRYDSSTARLDNTKWHRWQLKEILSFGFAYRFSTI